MDTYTRTDKTENSTLLRRFVGAHGNNVPTYYRNRSRQADDDKTVNIYYGENWGEQYTLEHPFSGSREAAPFRPPGDS